VSASTIDPADSLLSEGRRRLRAAGFTDSQASEWLARVTLWGGRITLTPVGLMASYERAGQ